MKTTKIKTKEEFINKAIQVHDYKYDYSKVDYKKAIDKIIIICKTHGEFLQQSNVHLLGSGCVKCFRDRNPLLQRGNRDEFIEKAINIHGNKYDYSKVDYIKSSEKVIIICKEHNEFLQTPNKHLQGGCKLCGIKKQTNKRSSNKEEFIKKAKEQHGDIYDYSKVEYVNNNSKVIITCKEHGDFSQTAGSHLQVHGCKKCATIVTSNKQKSNNEEFIKKAKEMHGDIYDYSKVEYINNNSKVMIICKEHGEFLQNAKGHIHKNVGCQKCSILQLQNKFKHTTETFIKKAMKTHGDKYDYSKVNYGDNGRVPIIIICKEHGGFLQKPQDHVSGCGCQKCGHRNYSKSSILYLNFISKLKNIKIQHGENSMEYKIPNTRFKADGYCFETNTIYEFHGTIYHGDPRCCNSADNNYFGKNYGDLYQKTLEREQLIRDLGYNLVIMWEHDWNKINKCIKILQKQFNKRFEINPQ